MPTLWLSSVRFVLGSSQAWFFNVTMCKCVSLCESTNVYTKSLWFMNRGTGRNDYDGRGAEHCYTVHFKHLVSR
uniref:Putative secreted protein n=1 Tax=Ixodes ricinus TaxID=34613 RepID=A0A6B0U341_IXORI